jgi:NADH:ubiquinone oxidoreductase subunit 5 (subunit L)/multisubunit Na+/H+ antiporter MnhA subunit
LHAPAYSNLETMVWTYIFLLMGPLSILLLRGPKLLWMTAFLVPFAGALYTSVSSILQRHLPPLPTSDFFAMMAMQVGALVCIYSSAYFDKESLKKFYPLFFTFCGSMLGVVWSDNIIAFFTFWELTSFCSFLLIGFKNEQIPARVGAKQALMVTAAGGLALLAALLLLQMETGSSSLRTILDYDGELKYSMTIMSLLIFAAMTKSAQVPFHFWLPGAMAAPTPVSCFLHSATMVKLGVYLMVMTSPLFAGDTRWTVLLCSVGAITLIWGLLVSLTRNDLKQLLAWTTVSSLGVMFILIGLQDLYAWKTLFIYIMAHAAYKASLFLCVGNIDKQVGTRDLRKLSDLGRLMPMTSVSLLLASGSMIGFPFTFGFLAKEYLFKSALGLSEPAYILVGVLICSSALSLAVTVRLLHPIFVRKQGAPQRIKTPASLRWPPLILALFGWVGGFFLEPINNHILNPLVSSLMKAEVDVRIKMWAGVNTPFLLSLFSMTLGLILWVVALKYLIHVRFKFTGEIVFEMMMDKVRHYSDVVTRFFQNGRLSFYAGVLLVLFVFLVLLQISDDGQLQYNFRALQESSGLVSLALLLFISGISLLLLMRQSLALVLACTIVGYGVGLLYLAAGATDLSMTQIAVESISIFVFVLTIRLLRTNNRNFSRIYQLLRLVLSLASFVAIYFLTTLMSTAKVLSRVSEYFRANALELGKGLNTVNVILVDFRALDTMGEITVLGTVGLACFYLLRFRHRDPTQLQDSLFLSHAVKILTPALNILSVYVLWRGHNKPGGGFIGGLILAASLGLYLMTFGEKSTRKFLLLSPTTWITTGLSTSLASGMVGPLFFGDAPFTAKWIQLGSLWLGTPLLFDLGVYWLVFGMSLQLILHLRARESA